MKLLAGMALLAFVAIGCTADAGDGNPTPDATALILTDGGLIPFLEPCETDEQCETGLCFPFNAAGPHCTHVCESDLECEAPSPGCNGKGVCKREH